MINLQCLAPYCYYTFLLLLLLPFICDFHTRFIYFHVRFVWLTIHSFAPAIFYTRFPRVICTQFVYLYIYLFKNIWVLFTHSCDIYTPLLHSLHTSFTRITLFTWDLTLSTCSLECVCVNSEHRRAEMRLCMFPTRSHIVKNVEQVRQYFFTYRLPEQLVDFNLFVQNGTRATCWHPFLLLSGAICWFLVLSYTTCVYWAQHAQDPDCHSRNTFLVFTDLTSE